MAWSVATSQNEARKTIDTRLKSLWTLTPILWPNTQQKTPTVRHIQIDLLFGDAEPVVLGGTSFHNEITGIIQLSVFCKTGSGAGEIYELAGQVAEVFSNYFGGGINCGAASRSGLESPDTSLTGFIRVLVTVPFVFYEFKA